jgi:hypothetical protein
MLLWPDQQMEMVAHQAISVQGKRLALLKIEQSLQKCLIVSRFEEDVLAVVATIDNVVHQTRRDQTKWSRHDAILPRSLLSANK